VKIIVFNRFIGELLLHLKVEGIAASFGEALNQAIPSLSNKEIPLNIDSKEDLKSLLGEVFNKFLALSPDLVIFALLDGSHKLKQLEEELLAFKKEIKVLNFFPLTFSQFEEQLTRIAEATGSGANALSYAARLKAQMMDWGDNFYERMKNKRVAVLSKISPLVFPGGLIPEMIKICSAVSFNPEIGGDALTASWSDLVKFRPDVVLVAPQDGGLKGAVSHFKPLSEIKEWQELPAVKRGEVIFLDGAQLYTPGVNLFDGFALLVSAIAGLESGYITPRDSFYRLRWIELHRHKFI
jgi:ABC-type Fe3+-hydroxamate transport system substrate-binding protein